MALGNTSLCGCTGGFANQLASRRTGADLPKRKIWEVVNGDLGGVSGVYELATDDEGFHVIITNPEDGTSSYIKLDPEEPNPDKLKPIWQEGVKEGPPRADLLSKVLLGFLLAAMCVCIAAAVIIKFM